MSNLKNKSWVKKYEPTTLDSYIFSSDTQQKLIQKIIDNRLDAHVLLTGAPGTGKTTLSNIIINSIQIDDSDLLKINASDENSVDIVREKIINFITTIPNGDFKVIQLEEADYFSLNAQAILRKILEDYEEQCKFIITCNYVHKIIPALKSRCRYQFEFKSPNKKSIQKFAVNILLKEKIKVDPKIFNKFISIYYPDIRKIIQSLQLHSIDGVLIEPKEADGNDDYKIKLIEYLDQNDWKSMRELVCDQVNDSEIESVYRFLYENLEQCKKFEKYNENWKTGQILIAESLYKDAIVSDREINLSMLFLKLWDV